MAVPATAAQAAPAWSYMASTGATYVKVLDGTVSSDLTAQSSVTGGPSSRESENRTASVKVRSLVRVGAAETRTTAVKSATTTTLNSWARTANVNLLDGLITIDAVETKVTTVARADGTASHTGNTQLAGIKIVGVDLPVRIPKNFTVTIPGVAHVSLNWVAHSTEKGRIATQGWALGLSLIKPRDGVAAGATVILNPVNQFLQDTPPSPGATLFGMAYGTRVDAHVGDDVAINSDPTAFLGTPYGGSNGETLRNTTATVNVPGVLNTGVVTSTSRSTKDTRGNAYIRNANKTAGLNLLGGLVRADAIEVVAVGQVKNGKWTSRMGMTTLNLVIAGRSIPVNVSPNTVINVAGLGKVELNRQQASKSGRVNRIDGVRIVLSTARAGLKAGAVIELGVAATQIR